MLGHADLTGEQDVLTGLGHRAVRGADDENRAVHLGGTGDHVLHIVSVAGAVNVRVVALRTFVFHVRHRDGHGLRFVTNGATLGDIRVGDRGEPLRFCTATMAAVRVDLPWSTWPIVPTFTCGFVR
jgi:hypothetical protein